MNYACAVIVGLSVFATIRWITRSNWPFVLHKYTFARTIVVIAILFFGVVSIGYLCKTERLESLGWALIFAYLCMALAVYILGTYDRR